MSIPAIETEQRPLFGLISDGYHGDIGIYNIPRDSDITEKIRAYFPGVTYVERNGCKREPGEPVNKTSVIFYDRGITDEAIFIGQLLMAAVNSENTIVISSTLTDNDKRLFSADTIIVDTLEEAIGILHERHYALANTE